MANITDYIKPHAVQADAFRHIGNGKIIFYGGARGGGKSWLSLAAAMTSSLQHPGLSTTVIRKTYPELQDVFLSKLERLFPSKVFKYKYIDRHKTCQFTNGSIIKFRAIDGVRDAEKAQGTETQFLVIDEAPNFPLDVIKLLMGSVRNAHIPTFKETILMTGNPGGLSDRFFKTHFVQLDFTNWTQYEKERFDMFVFVPAKVYDNPHIDQKAYIDKLMLQGETKRKAWLDGDWNTFEGQFFDEWEGEKHVVEPFDIPKEWRRVVGFDLGYTEAHPSVAVFIAQNPVTLDLYAYREYVSWGVVEKYVEDFKMHYKTEEANTIVFADPSMFDTSRRSHWSDESPAQMFMREGFPFVAANNDRINGWRMLKQWLHWTPLRPPKLRFFDTCRYLLQTLPSLQYTTSARTDVRREDLDTRAADDAADALRYAVVSGFGYPSIGYMEGLSVEEQNNLIKTGEVDGAKDWSYTRYDHTFKNKDNDNSVLGRLKNFSAVY